jgi:hypothetical protein
MDPGDKKARLAPERVEEAHDLGEVVPLELDDPRIENELGIEVALDITVQGADVPPQNGRLLKHGHIVRAVEKMRCHQASAPSSDDCDSQLPSPPLGTMIRLIEATMLVVILQPWGEFGVRA